MDSLNIRTSSFNVPKYEENRSRYYFIESTQGKETARNFGSDESISTGCNCEVRNDSIKIGMGLWVFGGFYVEITLNDKNYQVEYFEDNHNEEVYKYKITDTTLHSMIRLRVEESELLLNHNLSYNKDETVNGFLTFETPIYFEQDWNYETGAIMTPKSLKGKIYFTCKTTEPMGRVVWDEEQN